MDAAEWDARYRDQDLVWGAPPNATLVEYATSLPPGRALDLACGEGRNALWLATRGWTVTGIDYSGVALGKARTVAQGAPRSVRNRLHWVQGDVVAASYGADLNLVVMAFLHVPAEERRTILAHSASALARDGLLLVIAHDLLNLTEGCGGPQDASILFSPDDLVAELAELPMTVTTAQRIQRNTDYGTAIDLVVTATRS